MSTQYPKLMGSYAAMCVGITALYYFGPKESLVFQPLLNKKITKMALSVITQATLGSIFLRSSNKKSPNNSFSFTNPRLLPFASNSILGVCSHLCGVPLVANLFATTALVAMHASIVVSDTPKPKLPSAEGEQTRVARSILNQQNRKPITSNLSETMKKQNTAPPKGSGCEQVDLHPLFRRVNKEMPIQNSKKVKELLFTHLIFLLGNSQGKNLNTVTLEGKNLEPFDQAMFFIALAEITEELNFLQKARSCFDRFEGGKDIKARNKFTCLVRIAYAKKYLEIGVSESDISEFNQTFCSKGPLHQEEKRWIVDLEASLGNFDLYGRGLLN